jgi:hypothetical protein
MRSLFSILLVCGCGVGVWLVRGSPEAGGSDPRSGIEGPIPARSNGLWPLLVNRRPGASRNAVQDQRMFLRSFSHFRRAPLTPSVELSSRIESSVGRAISQFGFVRAIHIRGFRAWVMAKKGIACLAVAPSGSTSCSVMVEAIRHGLAVGIGHFKEPGNDPRPRYAVLGIAADWVGKIRVRIGRSYCYISPVHNAYILTSMRRIVVVKQQGSKQGSPSCGSITAS